jgi:hypothetical protein
MAVDYIGSGQPDGANFGRSDDKIGFYGLTAPIVQQDFTTPAITSSINKDTTVCWGFSDSTAATNIITLVNELRAKLVALNLVAT